MFNPLKKKKKYFSQCTKPCWAFSHYFQLSQLIHQCICSGHTHAHGSLLNQTMCLVIHFQANDLAFREESSLNWKAPHLKPQTSILLQREETGINLQ